MKVQSRKYRGYSSEHSSDDDERKEMKKASRLDQYFTRPDIAELCVEMLQGTLSVDLISYFDIFLEPSYGRRAFIDALMEAGVDPERIVMYDIDADDLQFQADFLTLEQPVPPQARVLTVGNPPFGKRAQLAIDFFNRAARFSQCIAFIVPFSFTTDKVKQKLDSQFLLVQEMDLSFDKHYIYQNRAVGVRSIFQIWVHQDAVSELMDDHT